MSRFWAEKFPTDPQSRIQWQELHIVVIDGTMGKVFDLASIHTLSIQFFGPLSRSFIGIDPIWDMFGRLQIQLHQKFMHLHPGFWWQLGSFLHIPGIIRTIIFLFPGCRTESMESGLPQTKQLHKSNIADWTPLKLDMPHSPTGSVLAFEHPKDLGRQVDTLEVSIS